MVIAVHTKAKVVLAAVRTAAHIWWAILKEMAPKAASSLSSQTATSWAVTGGGGSRTYSGLRDGAVYDPPEVLVLQPELHLVNPNVIVRPIEDGDGGFYIGGGGGRHFGCWVSKKEARQHEIFP